MRRLKFKKLSATMAGAVAIVASGCTTERAYDRMDIDKTSQVKPERKSLIDTNTEYLYVPSSLNSTRTTNATFPMYMGEAKIVKLQMTEDALKIVQVEEDERFRGNPVNQKPVLSIPIEHIDFRCAKDADGKCTNTEELDNSKPWSQRNFLKIQADRLAVQEINFLPLEIKNLFYPCYNEVDSSFIGYKLEKDAINIGIEKVYKTRVECAGKFGDLSDLTFKAVYHYSLMKLDKVTTPKYKALKYSRAEESTFGFFDTFTRSLDRDNNSTESGAKTFLNRWAPARKVVYHLTENFNKPQYAKIKAATIKAVASINHSLALAGAQLKIDLQDAEPGMNPGDLRVNSIVMIEDPLSYGILGYGPTAANPRTGEIVHARTAMYLGVIKTTIKNAYDEVVKEKLSTIAKGQAQTQEKSGGDLEKIGIQQGQISLAPELQKYSGARLQIDAKKYAEIKRGLHLDELENDGVVESAQSVASGSEEKSESDHDIKPPINEAKLLNYGLRREERRLTSLDAVMLKDDPSTREQILSTHCFYDIENFNIHAAIEEEIEKMISQVGTKPWIQLTDEEKDHVIDTLLPFVWVPTLIHEIGHTLGLRHNFAGSEDKANFYSAEELAEMGITRQFTYSSVMDYGYKSTNELQIMGKYDLAALRFGYAEKVELADGQLVSIDEFRAGPGLKLKPYMYCTDEHVAVNPACKRFDEGTSIVEIAQHWITMYQQNYSRRNFRNGLYDFSLYDDETQINRVGMVMGNLRKIFERYIDIKQTFNLTDDSTVWEQFAFLKDLKTASRMAGHFFIQVLEIPDVMCAVAAQPKPTQIVAVVPLRDLSPNAITCFDQENVSINPAYVIVGEGGKSFQSRKSPNSNNPYMDQIDVRGIWIDKLLAAQALVERLTGIESYDRFTDNFLDLSDMREPVQKALSAILTDEVITKLPIFTVTNQVLVAELPIRLYDAAEGKNGHKIQKPLHPGVQKFFEIPDKGIDFQMKLVQLLKSELPSHRQQSDATSLLNSIAAHAGLPNGNKVKDFIQATIGLQPYFVHQRSKVAAASVIARDIQITFTKLGEEKLNQILAAIAAGKPLPRHASDAEKFARRMGPQVIEKFLEGGFQDVRYYEQMLQVMAE